MKSDNHGLKGGLVKELMGKEMTMKIYIQKRFCLGHKACYQVFELTAKTTEYIQLKSSREIGWLAAANSSNNVFAFCMYIVTESPP
jgi:hypothetical protein